MALKHKKADAAVELLRVTSSYEPGAVEASYVRGRAYLALRDGSAATAEFKKIVDHPSFVLTSPLGPLAHLGLARAYALSGDTVKALTKYQDFLTLWKDADPDIPILKEAEAEYAKLR